MISTGYLQVNTNGPHVLFILFVNLAKTKILELPPINSPSKNQLHVKDLLLFYMDCNLTFAEWWWRLDDGERCRPLFLKPITKQTISHLYVLQIIREGVAGPNDLNHFLTKPTISLLTQKWQCDYSMTMVRRYWSGRYFWPTGVHFTLPNVKSRNDEIEALLLDKNGWLILWRSCCDR